MTQTRNANPTNPVRALFRAATVASASAPHDTVMFKIFYPARATGDAGERNSGLLPAAGDGAPFPAVIVMPGVNCGCEAYQWLAVELAQRNMVVLTYNWVGEVFPGMIGLTPGMDFAGFRPENFGRNPTALALPPALQLLDDLHRNDSSPLKGLLALDRVVLGGHSAGGTLALLNAKPKWFPQIAAAFSYAAHTGATTALGYEPGTILPIDTDVPLLLMGGTRDGVIASSSGRYGDKPGDPMAFIKRTFDEAVTGGRGDTHVVFIDGANHGTMTYPADSTAGRLFLDLEPTRNEAELRQLVAVLAGDFIASEVCGQSDAGFGATLAEYKSAIAFTASK